MSGPFDLDPWAAARQYHERQMFMFVARVMRHFGVTQMELPNYPVSTSDQIEARDMPEKGATFYRIKGELALQASAPEEQGTVPAELLYEACIVALAISGRFSDNPDEWLRGHEARLRELEKIAKARRDMNNGGK
jgi:hypothetical protein